MKLKGKVALVTVVKGLDRVSGAFGARGANVVTNCSNER